MVKQLVGDKILIKRDDADNKTKSGLLYIPEAAKEQPSRGTVVRVGSGNYDNDGVLIPVQLKEGDYVIFQKYAGCDIEIEGETYVIVREQEVIAAL